jgi:drug/metabolite transporter (DMT)-like permease
MMLLSSLLFAVMSMLVKLAAAQGVPSSEAAFVRLASGMALVGALKRSGAISLETRRVGMLVTRGLLGSAAMLLFYASITGTRLANAALLNYTYFVFGPLFCVLFLRQRLSPRAAVAFPIALLGVWVVLDPRFGGFRWGDAAGLLSGVLAGGSIVTIRELRRTESSFTILWYFCLVGSIVAAVVALPHAVWPTPRGATLLLGVAVAGTAGQWLLTEAFRSCTVAGGGLLSLTTVLYTAILGHAVFGEPLTARFAWGGGLVLAAAAWLIREEQRTAPLPE